MSILFSYNIGHLGIFKILTWIQKKEFMVQGQGLAINLVTYKLYQNNLVDKYKRKDIKSENKNPPNTNYHYQIGSGLLHV